ncbi:acetyl-CoA carboxylase biotin carboxyl carrier protein subunit [Croceitalea sp. MTPC9]|uniref:acetyl-CoA carboxylase biotin carboxyl carrier protein subunit n=1 Tax=unclassified Croceitalea TaxID=2632280 RepID=UPI002B37DC76|nr:acetyl-CoA carboxylase biotin carboxyl carrier protein subunit [Croceitalea sp. MTPC6]GMN16172.1 acetyl-CoA carboxylase biotin carboxyl carrier protein subunit [Croceitalea sp. MTPC9]
MSKYLVEIDDNSFEISNKNLRKLDLTRLNDDNFHLLYNNIAYRVNVISSNYQEKIVTVEVNGNSYSMKISDSYDQTVKQMGLLVGNSKKAKDIKAPMPGLIINVMVKQGQEISEGTPLIILSAMKMENILLAQADGIIKSINVKKEDTVDKGQIIIEIE